MCVFNDVGVLPVRLVKELSEPYGSLSKDDYKAKAPLSPSKKP